MRIPILFAFLAIGLSAFSQSFQLNDYQRDYLKNDIHSRMCIEIIYENGAPVDTLMISKVEFDQKGRVVQYTQFFAKKRELYHINYEYNLDGTISSCKLSHLFHGWEPVDLIVQEENGKLLSLECPIEIRNFWKKESYSYSKTGRIASSVQMDMKDGEWAPRLSQEYSSTIHSGENSPTFIHNPSGLLHMQQNLNDSGQIKSTLLFSYTHY